MLPQIVTVNPLAKHRRKRKHNPLRHSRRAHYAMHHRRRNPMRHRRRRHSNPFSARGMTHQVTGALIGAAGAIGTDVAMAYLPLPASLQSGWMNLLARAAVAVGVGYVAGKAVGKSTGQAVTAGGLIVVAYSGLKQALAPTLGASIKGLSGLADFGDYRPAYGYGMESAAMQGAGMGAYMQPRLGAYMRSGMGAYMNPAPFLASPASASPIVAKQRAMAGYGGFGGYDSDSM